MQEASNRPADQAGLFTSEDVALASIKAADRAERSQIEIWISASKMTRPKHESEK